MKLTKEVVISALQHVFFPDQKEDIIALGAVKNIQISITTHLHKTRIILFLKTTQRV